MNKSISPKINKSIADIKAEENILRDKLKELRMLEKTYFKKNVHYEVSGKVKSNK